MALGPVEKRKPDRRLGGFASFPTFGSQNNFDLNTPEGLLRLAQLQGGSIGEVADEIVDPKSSFLSRVGEIGKEAFGTFVDVISLPSEIVAGVISPDLTVREAIRTDALPSEVIFGEPDPDDTAMQKVGNWIVRTTTDILLDPLTYVTFGAAKGIFGITGRVKVSAKSVFTPSELTRLGKSADDIVELADDALRPRDVFVLSDKGEELFTKRLAMQERGIQRIAELQGKAQKLKGKELDDFIGRTIRSQLNEDYVKESIAKLIQKNPEMAKVLVDKGGIKLFGKSILEGQRIQAAIHLIPGISMIDSLTTPTRNVLGAMFSRGFDPKFGRLPSEFVELETKYGDLLRQKKVSTFSNLSNVVRELKLTNREAEILMSSIEHMKIPKDERLFTAFLRLKGINKSQLKAMRRNGMRVSELSNHMPHMVKEQVKVARGFMMPPSQGNALLKPRRIGKFLDIETGEAITGDFKKLGLKVVVREREVSRISRNLETYAERVGSNIDELKGEVGELSEAVQDVFRGKAKKELERVMREVPLEDRINMEVVMESVMRRIGGVDVQKIKRTARKLDSQEKISKALSELSPEAFERLRKSITEGAIELSGDNLQMVNFGLRESAKRLKKTSVKKTASEAARELRDFLAGLRGEIKGLRKIAVESSLNEDAVSLFSAALVESFERDPAGLQRIMKSIMGRETKITKLFSDLANERKLAEKAVEELPEDAIFFRKGEKLFRSVPVSAEELNTAIGKTFYETNAVSVLAKRGAKIDVATTMRDFIQDVAKNYGKKASEAPSGWRRVNVTGLQEDIIDFSNFATGKKGEELFFHPAIAKRIENFSSAMINDEATTKFLQAFDDLQNVFKASVTSIFPAFHGRNGISNVLLNYLDIGLHAFNPGTQVVAGDLLRKDRILRSLEREMVHIGERGVKAREQFAELMQTIVVRDRTGREWSFGELRTMLRENQIAMSPYLKGPIDLDMKDRTFVDQLMPKDTKSKLKKFSPLSREFAPYSAGFEFGSMVEQQARLVNFITNLSKTGDPTLSIQRTKQFLFDYQNLTNFERAFLRRILPFYSFTRKNLERQVASILTTPGRISSEVKAITTISEVFSGGKLSEEEEKLLPEWMRKGSIVVVERNKERIKLFTGLETPIEQPFEALTPQGLLSQVTPLLKVPFEQATGYSVFHGKEIQQVSNADAYLHAPEALKDFIGFHKVSWKDEDGSERVFYTSLRPRRMHLFSNIIPTSRVLSELRFLSDPDISIRQKALHEITGVKVREVDLEREEMKRERETKQRLQELLDNAGVIATFERAFIPKD